MKYRSLCGDKVSVLGFGAMRFPTVSGKGIDFEKTKEMLEYAHDKGVNYFDTAYMYHQGKSETVLGEILSGWPRDSYFLADKIPTWACETTQDVERIFHEQLKRCKVDYFDYYLIHSIHEGNYKNIKKAQIVPFLLEQKRIGTIRHIGFSFHGSAELLKELLAEYDCFEFAQLQLNYFDWDYINAKELHKIARRHNLPVIVMEPVRGGMLASLPEEAENCLREYNSELSTASWAIRYAMNIEGVLTVLSGMSSMEQLEDNLQSADLDPFNQEEYDTLYKALEIFKSSRLVLCTGCRYCMDCAVGIDIPGVIRLYNDYRLNGNAGFKANYDSLAAKPKDCISCRICVGKCPQGLKIDEIMSHIAECRRALL